MINIQIVTAKTTFTKSMTAMHSRMINMINKITLLIQTMNNMSGMKNTTGNQSIISNNIGKTLNV